MFILNTLIVAKAQNNKGQQTNVLIQHNHKRLFTCELVGFNTSFSKKNLDLPLDRSYLGFQSFEKPRTLNVAVLATGEYSQYFIKKNKAETASVAKQKQIVLNAIEETIANSNKILKRDLGVELKLISNNKKLIFLDPKTDNLSGNNALLLINEITSKVNALIAPESYDLGQVFFTGTGGLSVVKSAFGSRKAQAVTGANVPEGKIFDVDFFTHEIGHQLGATHTQNSNCSRNSSSSIEPGSGSTIMGYAGVCNLKNSNVSFTSKSYFHNYSILQVREFLEAKDSRTKVNKNYGLDIIPDYTIPKETAFEIILKPVAPPKSSINYSCNQIDNQLAPYPPTKEQLHGPVFSAQKLSNSPVIYFPEKDVVLNGNQEVTRGILSSVARSYNFLASARIKNNNQSITSIRRFKVKVLNIPSFTVNSQQDETIIWEPGTKETITWEVGATQKELKVNYVDILLSNNNGKSFDYTLASKVPNNGKQIIKVPLSISSNNCRIKIKAYNSIFYAVNTKRFSITPFYAIAYNNKNQVDFSTTTSSVIAVNKEVNFEDIELGIKLAYTDISKLKIRLSTPSGKQIILWDNYCSEGTNLEIQFKDNESIVPKDDFSKKTICEPVLLGFKAPTEAFKNLSAEKTKGNWQLEIIKEGASEHFGKLKEWSIHFKAKGSKNKLSDLKNSENVLVYPNPIKEKFIIQFKEAPKSEAKVEVYSFSGNLTKSFVLEKGLINEVFIDSLPSGIYFLRIYFENQVINRKITIN